MTFEDLPLAQRALLAALTGLDAGELQALWERPDNDVKELSRRRCASLGIENAIKDFQTVVLGSQSILPTEDWIRLWILRCSQFMPARYLYAATFGDQWEFNRLARSPAEMDEPWFLILEYVRATRSPRSATEHSRNHFLGYPVEPPEEMRTTFGRLVEAVRRHGLDSA